MAEQWFHRSCSICEASCGIRVLADRDTRKVLRIEGNPDDPIDVGFTVWIAAYGPLGQLIESSLVSALPDGAAGGVWWDTTDPITTTMRFSGDGAIYDVDITATTGL